MKGFALTLRQLLRAPSPPRVLSLTYGRKYVIYYIRLKSITVPLKKIHLYSYNFAQHFFLHFKIPKVSKKVGSTCALVIIKISIFLFKPQIWYTFLKNLHTRCKNLLLSLDGAMLLWPFLGKNWSLPKVHSVVLKLRYSRWIWRWKVEEKKRGYWDQTLNLRKVPKKVKNY